MIRSMKSTPKDPSPHILVVDDTPENLQIVGETLSLHVDCDLAFATDGYRALDSVLASPPELILLDVMMPGMDGLEVCRRLKANPATADIPVLFLTAKVESADVVAGFEAGAVDYVLKPFNPSELVARVRTQLRIRQAELERRRLEASNRLLEKTESLGRMAAAVAHVFNNQLQALLGNLELASFALQDGENPRTMLDEAMRATRKAAELSGLMVTYLGQARAHGQRVDLADLFRKRLDSSRAAFPAGIDVAAVFPSSPAIANANPEQMLLLLDHLLANAREAIGDRPGSVQVSLRRASPSPDPDALRFPPDWEPRDDSFFCLEVADSGCGIPEADLEKVFDPFFSTKFTGRGMGLAVALGIARTHGGAIRVESSPNEGSSFQVFIPAAAHSNS